MLLNQEKISPSLTAPLNCQENYYIEIRLKIPGKKMEPLRSYLIGSEERN